MSEPTRPQCSLSQFWQDFRQGSLYYTFVGSREFYLRCLSMVLPLLLMALLPVVTRLVLTDMLDAKDAQSLFTLQTYTFLTEVQLMAWAVMAIPVLHILRVNGGNREEAQRQALRFNATLCLVTGALLLCVFLHELFDPDVISVPAGKHLFLEILFYAIPMLPSIAIMSVLLLSGEFRFSVISTLAGTVAEALMFLFVNGVGIDFVDGASFGAFVGSIVQLIILLLAPRLAPDRHAFMNGWRAVTVPQELKRSILPWAVVLGVVLMLTLISKKSTGAEMYDGFDFLEYYATWLFRNVNVLITAAFALPAALMIGEHMSRGDEAAIRQEVPRMCAAALLAGLLIGVLGASCVLSMRMGWHLGRTFQAINENLIIIVLMSLPLTAVLGIQLARRATMGRGLWVIPVVVGFTSLIFVNDKRVQPLDPLVLILCVALCAFLQSRADAKALRDHP